MTLPQHARATRARQARHRWAPGGVPPPSGYPIESLEVRLKDGTVATRASKYMYHIYIYIYIYISFFYISFFVCSSLSLSLYIYIYITTGASSFRTQKGGRGSLHYGKMRLWGSGRVEGARGMTIVYYTILYCTILYYTILYYNNYDTTPYYINTNIYYTIL